MIRHRPAGRGHPYLVEPDQRVPVRPVAGEDVELRATTDAGASSLRVELEIDGARRVVEAAPRGAAVPEVVGDYGVPAPRVEEGHLSDAVSRLGEQRGRTSWGAVVPATGRLRYRFLANGSRTRWFEVDACAWTSADDALDVVGADNRLVPGSVELLTGGGRAFRLRFALRIEDGDRHGRILLQRHPCAFGEAAGNNIASAARSARIFARAPPPKPSSITPAPRIAATPAQPKRVRRVGRPSSNARANPTPARAVQMTSAPARCFSGYRSRRSGKKIAR